MRIACLYDIHANLPALDAVLAEVDRLGVDRIVVGGDVALGPMPRPTLERLDRRADRITYVLGNCDRDMAEVRHGRLDPTHAALERIRWSAGQLPDEKLDWLGALPLTLTLEVDGLGRVLFCHGTPRDCDEIFTRLTPDERLAEIFRDVRADVVVCGHTHVQFDRRVGGVRIVNAGSVGMPFEGRTGAFWTLLGPDLRLMRTEYDVAAAADVLEACGCPDLGPLEREKFLHPWTAEYASTTFEKYAVEQAKH